MSNCIHFKILIMGIIFGLCLGNFSFAQTQPITPPKTLQEAKEMGRKAVETTEKEWPGILEKIWKKGVLPIWKKMYNWFITNIWPKIKAWFKGKVEPGVKEEIEKRKPIIEEELKKEKEEMKEELPKVSKSIWEKFKQLIK